MWLSLVERLLWEQDAAGSNPVIRTTQRELPLAGGSLCVFLLPGWVCGSLRAKQGACFGQNPCPLPVADEGQDVNVQRSTKLRKCVSPKILSGTATGDSFAFCQRQKYSTDDSYRYVTRWGAIRPPPVAEQGRRASGRGR